MLTYKTQTIVRSSYSGWEKTRIFPYVAYSTPFSAVGAVSNNPLRYQIVKRKVSIGI